MCSKQNRRFKFNMITGVNELKILTKQISGECKWKFDGGKVITAGIRAKIKKNKNICEKILYLKSYSMQFKNVEYFTVYSFKYCLLTIQWLCVYNWSCQFGSYIF